MKNNGELTLFERFDLSLSMLVSLHQRLGVPAEILRRAKPGADYRPQLCISKDLLREVRHYCGLMEEVFSDERQFYQSESTHPDLEATAVDGAVRELRQFDSRVGKWHERAQSLLGLPSLSQEDFDEFGLAVDRGIHDFKKSECFEELKSHSSPERRLGPLRGVLRGRVRDRIIRQRLEEVLIQTLYVTDLIRHVLFLLFSNVSPARLTLISVHCYYECRSFFVRVDDLRRFLPRGDILYGSLEMAASALRMEATRALKRELLHLDAETDSDAFLVRVERALGIVHNGFENALRNIAQGLDPAFDIDRVLDDPRLKYQEASNLVTDVGRLQERTRQLEQVPSEKNSAAFRSSLDLFKENSVPALFGADRRAFRKFEEELQNSPPESMKFVLHRFEVYLSTLLAQIRNRGVLARTQRPEGQRIAAGRTAFGA